MFNSKKALTLAVLSSTLFSSQFAFSARQDINGADVLGVTADGIAEGVQFTTDHKLTVQNNENIGDTGGDSVIAPGGNGFGTLQFDGNSAVSGNITPAGNILKLIDINAQNPGETVTITGAARANDINVSTANGNLVLNGGATVTNDLDFLANGKVQLAGGQNFTGAIDATGGAAGTFEFLGASNVTGAIGATNGLNLLTINGGAVTTNENVTATTTNFAADGSLSIADTKNITSNVTNTTTNQGTLTFLGASTATGNLGSTGAGLKLITVGNGGNTVNTTGDIKATSVNFAADGKLVVADGKSITGNATTTTNNTGTLSFAGDGTFTGVIGTTGGNKLKVVELAGVKTLNTTQDINATDFNFLANGILNVAAGKNVNGLISGPGGSGGTVNFAGNSTSGGKLGNANALAAVNVNAGTFTLNHDIAATTTTVAAGATLLQNTNNLNVGPNLVNNGMLNIGGNTLNVSGVFTQNATGTLSVNITSPTTTGNVVDAGNAVVNAGSSVNVSVVNTIIPDGTKLKVIGSAGGVGVNVPNVLGNTQNYSFSFSTENGAAPGKDLFVLVNRNSFSESTNNPALTGLANYLEALAPIATTTVPDLVPLINALDLLPDAGAMEEAMQTLIPLIDGGLFNGSQNNVERALTAISSRLDKLKLADAGFSGFSAGDVVNPVQGTWAQIFASSMEQDARGSIAGYDGTHIALAVGHDWAVNEQLSLGGALSYSHTALDSNAAAGSEFDINTVQGSLYANYWFDVPVYVDAMLAVAYHDYTSIRNIIIPPAGGLGGIQARADGDFNGWQSTFWAESGYKWQKNNFLAIPFVNLLFTHLSVSEYTEDNAGSLNLNVKNDDQEALKLGGGIKFAYAKRQNDYLFVPQVKLAIAYDFIQDNQITSSSFYGGGASFITPGPEPKQTSLIAGAGLAVHKGDKNHFYLMYDYEHRDDFSSHNGFIKYLHSWG